MGQGFGGGGEEEWGFKGFVASFLIIMQKLITIFFPCSLGIFFHFFLGSILNE
jgi:hypothetical protein